MKFSIFNSTISVFITNILSKFRKVEKMLFSYEFLIAKSDLRLNQLTITFIMRYILNSEFVITFNRL